MTGTARLDQNLVDVVPGIRKCRPTPGCRKTSLTASHTAASMDSAASPGACPYSDERHCHLLSRTSKELPEIDALSLPASTLHVLRPPAPVTNMIFKLLSKHCAHSLRCWHSSVSPYGRTMLLQEKILTKPRNCPSPNESEDEKARLFEQQDARSNKHE